MWERVGLKSPVRERPALSVVEGPHAGILRQAQYRSVRGQLGDWQSYRDGAAQQIMCFE